MNKKMKSRILILVLILLVIAIIGTVLYSTKTINDIKSEIVTINHTDESKSDMASNQSMKDGVKNQRDLYDVKYEPRSEYDRLPPELIILSDDAIVHVFSGADAMADEYGFSNNQEYFYKCQGTGHLEGFVQVYSVPDFDLVYDVKNDLAESFFAYECGEYDVSQNEFTFSVAEDWDDVPQVLIYDFDEMSIKK